MVDLKEFLEKDCQTGVEQFDDGTIEITGKEEYIEDIEVKRFVDVDKLGLFFWDRGGKQFVINCKSLKFNVWDKCNGKVVGNWYQQNFQDALDCLGEDRVKELIKELV